MAAITTHVDGVDGACEFKDMWSSRGNGIIAEKTLCLFSDMEPELLQLPDQGWNGIAGRFFQLAHAWIFNLGHGTPFFATQNTKTVILIPLVVGLCRIDDGGPASPVKLSPNGVTECAKLKRRTIQYCAASRHGMGVDSCTSHYLLLEKLAQGPSRSSRGFTKDQRQHLIPTITNILQLSKLSSWWDTDFDAAVPEPNAPDGPTVPAVGDPSTVFTTNDEDTICFYRKKYNSQDQEQVVIRRSGADMTLAFEALTKRTDNRRNSFLIDEERLALLKTVAQSVPKETLGDNVCTQQYKLRRTHVLGALQSLLNDVPKEKIVSVLHGMLNSKAFTIKFDVRFSSNIRKIWWEWSAKAGATIYQFSKIGKMEYNSLYKLLPLPPEIQMVLGTKKLLPRYDRQRTYTNEHLVNEFEEQAYQYSAQIYGPNTTPVKGASVPFWRQPSLIVNNIISYETYIKYNEQLLMKGWLILEKVRFKVGVTVKDVPWHSEEAYDVNLHRTFLCEKTELSQVDAICTENGAWSKNLITLSIAVGAGAVVTTDADTGTSRGPVYGIVVQLFVGESDWNMFIDAVHPDCTNPDNIPRNNANKKRVVTLLPFQPNVAFNYKLLCDIDGTHVAARAGQTTGNAGFTSTFCSSASWTNGLQKDTHLAGLVSILAGDDSRENILMYYDSNGGRARMRKELTSTVYTLENKPVILNTQWVVDSKCGASCDGSGAGNARCQHIPWFCDCRDDSVSMNDPNKMQSPIDWSGSSIKTGACIGSYVHELIHRTRICADTLKRTLGVESLSESVPKCLIELKKQPRDESKLQATCKQLYPATRPHFTFLNVGVGVGVHGVQNGRPAFKHHKCPACLQFHKILIKVFNCERQAQPATVAVPLNGYLRKGMHIFGDVISK